MIESPTTGVVQVKLLNAFGENISTNMVPFEYTELKDKYKEELKEFQSYIDKNVTSTELCRGMLKMTIKKMEELEELNSKEGTSCNGKYHFKGLRLLPYYL